MFTHEQIWRGIDRLAAHAQTSPSGLARRAGLDSTTFNPSKRFSRDGHRCLGRLDIDWNTPGQEFAG